MLANRLAPQAQRGRFFMPQAKYLHRNLSLMFKSCVFAICLLASSVCANGAIIVQVQNATITTGGSGFVDVMISSAGSDNLYAAGYEFEITGDILNGSLRFLPSFDPGDPLNPLNQSSSEQSVSGPRPYVFRPNTSVDNFYANLGTSETSLLGADFGSVAANVTLNSTQRLLARLEIQHITSTPTAAMNDTFSIMLKNTSQTVFSSVDNQGTVADISDDIITQLDIDGSSFTNVGTITFNSTAVPEPGTLGVLSLAAVAYFGRRLHHRRRRPLAE